MDNPSAPERSSPEAIKPTPLRPPGVEFALGIAVFGFCLTVFFVSQSTAFLAQVTRVLPGYEGFSLQLATDPEFMRLAEGYMSNGDVIGPTAVWSGVIASFALLGMVLLWKGPLMRQFLGLGGAHPVAFLRWAAIFALLVVGIEALGRFAPAFRTDFMGEVLATTTRWWPLLLGVGVLQPLFEELLLRGVLLGSLRHVAEEHTAIALSAGVFALMHLQYEWTVMLLIVPMGAVLGYARTRTGSIWVPVVLHVLNNSLSVAFG
jgi:membrane protease YdiL (CAAX protease family)